MNPVISRLGCNNGTCHGSQKGRNGFKLSLRGYDPLFDHQALTDDLAARRFNRVVPDQSLLLLKAIGRIPHGGGAQTGPGESYYQLLHDWIANGVPFDVDSPRVIRIELRPQNPIVPRAGMSQQVAVVATYSDGNQQDVTAETIFESGNTEVATVSSRGLVRLNRRGEAAVLARYQGTYASTTITVMGDRLGFQWSDPEEFNYIFNMEQAREACESGDRLLARTASRGRRRSRGAATN